MRTRLLNLISYLILRRPMLVVSVAVALAIVCGVYAWSSLHLNADTNDLISPNRPFMKKYLEFLDEFGDLEFIYVVVEKGSSVEETEQCVESLLTRLRSIPDLTEVHGTIEPHEKWRIATRAMSIEELRGLVEARAAFPGVLNGESAASLLERSDAWMGALIRESNSLNEKQQEQLGAAALFTIHSVVDSPADDPSDAREYLRSDSGRFYFIEILPAKNYGTLAVIEQPLREIRSVINQTRTDFPDLEIGLTGMPVLQAEEMATSNRDMTRAAVIALILCTILFIAFTGGVKRPLLAVLAFACGAAWTFGATTLFIGQLNLLSNVFILVLVGVGLDYGVHVIARYREIRTHRSIAESMKEVMQTAVRGNVTGAITSSIAFFVAIFTSFQGLRELGAIAGSGLIFCLLAMTLVLPALLVLADRGLRFSRHVTEDEERGIGHHGIDPFAFLQLAPAWPRTTIIGCLILTGIFAFLPGRIHFEDNLLKLQAKGIESVEWENRILEDSSAASWFGAVVADNLQEVQDIVERAKKYEEIGQIRSVLDVIQPPSDERTTLRKAFHESVTLPPVTNSSESRRDLVSRLNACADKLAVMRAGAVATGHTESAQELGQLELRCQNLSKEWSDGKAGSQRAEELRNLLESNLTQARLRLETMLEGDTMPLRKALPAALRDQAMAPTGRFLIMLHPKENVWNMAAMQRFVSDLKSIDPNATGVPFTHVESLRDMRSSFVQMSIMAVIAIAILIYIDFRTISDVVLAMLPLVIGVAWMLEIMSYFDISFNLANFFALPIIIGLSVDAGVHLLHRYHEGGPMRLNPGATRRAVILTGLTTVIGFGSLSIAHHRGLQSLGSVMMIGIGSCLLAAVIVLPAVLSYLERRQLKSANGTNRSANRK